MPVGILPYKDAEGNQARDAEEAVTTIIANTFGELTDDDVTLQLDVSQKRLRITNEIKYTVNYQYLRTSAHEFAMMAKLGWYAATVALKNDAIDPDDKDTFKTAIEWFEQIHDTLEPDDEGRKMIDSHEKQQGILTYHVMSSYACFEKFKLLYIKFKTTFNIETALTLAFIIENSMPPPQHLFQTGFLVLTGDVGSDDELVPILANPPRRIADCLESEGMDIEHDDGELEEVVPPVPVLTTRCEKPLQALPQISHFKPKTGTPQDTPSIMWRMAKRLHDRERAESEAKIKMDETTNSTQAKIDTEETTDGAEVEINFEVKPESVKLKAKAKRMPNKSVEGEAPKPEVWEPNADAEEFHVQGIASGDDTVHDCQWIDKQEDPGCNGDGQATGSSWLGVDSQVAGPWWLDNEGWQGFDEQGSHPDGQMDPTDNNPDGQVWQPFGIADEVVESFGSNMREDAEASSHLDPAVVEAERRRLRKASRVRGGSGPGTVYRYGKSLREIKDDRRNGR